MTLVACAHAEPIIRELKESGGYDDPSLTMVGVIDEAGKEIFTIQFH
jgi:hypothetical protein